MPSLSVRVPRGKTGTRTRDGPANVRVTSSRYRVLRWVPYGADGPPARTRRAVPRGAPIANKKSARRAHEGLNYLVVGRFSYTTP